ncbi:MAG: hypothetical protein ACI3X9_10820 [Bacteroidaceae bacterium]
MGCFQGVKTAFFTSSQIRPNGNKLFLLRPDGQIEGSKKVKTIDVFWLGRCETARTMAR